MDMTLQANDLFQTYRHLYRIFHEDIHIGRPLIQMFQQLGNIDAAYNVASELGRRMFASGQTSCAVPLFKLCQQLKHEYDSDISSMLAIAEVMSDSPQEQAGQVFALIEKLSDQEGLNFIRQAKLITSIKGETLIHEGEVGHQFYMILQGHMSVHIHLDDDTVLNIKTLSDGDYFGEYACIYKLPRTATIIAVEVT